MLLNQVSESVLETEAEWLTYTCLAHYLSLDNKATQFEALWVALPWSTSLGGCYTLTIYIYSLVPLLKDNLLLLHTCIIIMKPEKSKPIFKKVFSSSDPKSKYGFVPMAALRVLSFKLNWPQILY